MGLPWNIKDNIDVINNNGNKKNNMQSAINLERISTVCYDLYLFHKLMKDSII